MRLRPRRRPGWQYNLKVARGSDRSAGTSRDRREMGSSPSAVPTAVRPVAMPFVDRLASAVVTAAPPIMLGIGMWFGWTGNILNWQDLLILALFYVGVGTGVTVGFHRLLTHRSFKCHSFTRAALAAL